MSREARRYAHAPITEAVIDIRIQPVDGVGLDRIAVVHQREAERYPKRADRVESRFVLTGGSASSLTQGIAGYLCRSTDGKQVFQSRLDGFTFSRLAPYESWEAFRDEAHRLWQVYLSVVTPCAVTRLGVRYINRLDLPLPVTDFEDYVRTVPRVAPGLPQALSGYYMQVQIPQTDLDAVLILNEGVVQPPSPEFASVVLDIDLYRNVMLRAEDPEVWSILEQFRWRKNEVFEACITDATRRLID